MQVGARLARIASSIALAAGVAVAAEPPVSRTLPPAGIPFAAAGPKAGEARPIAFNRAFEESGVQALRSTDLQWEPADGGFIGRFLVRSEGARALRLGIAPGPFSDGVELRFGEPAAARPASTLKLSHLRAHGGIVWTPVVLGELAEVEVFVPAALDPRSPLFSISRLSHFHEHPVREKAAAPCHRDIACYSFHDGAVKSTLAMTITAQNGQSWGCTGTLMNTDPTSLTPYVLTHSRCIRNAAEAASMIAFFDYEATTCGGSAVRSSYTMRSGGSVLLSRDPNEGYALARLNDSAPGSAWYAGWSLSTRPVGTPVYAVHHPAGDVKKAGVGSVIVSSSEVLVRFSEGITEGTSIGSGIFEGEARLIGLLDRTESSCANPTAADAYRPFWAIYPGVQSYLRPTTQAIPNLSDIWWNPGESGWGVTLADHETDLFVVWYTYRADGSPTWFVIPGGTFSENRRRFTGTAYQTTGPAYNAPFSSRPVTASSVGSVSFDFAPPGLAAGVALFSYNINGISGTKQIQRQAFGNAPANWGTDLTELWWDPNESGWGLSVNQHGNQVFVVWYTYDVSGQPLFMVMPGASFSGSAVFTGDLYTTRGPYFGGPFIGSQVQVIPFGDATIDFSGATTSVLAKIWNPRSGKLKVRPRPGSGSQPFNKVLKQQRYGYDAPATPPVSCTPSYGAWSTCQADGFRYRMLASTGCPGPAVDFEACSQSQPVACTSHSYTDWSACQNGTRTRQLTSSAPPGCTGGVAPVLTEPCTLAPLCTYTIGSCSACVNGTEQCTVTASPAGCRPNNPPSGTRPCGTQPVTGVCRGSGSITLSGVLRDPRQSQICPNPFQNFPPQSIAITIEPESWNQTTPQIAQVHIDKGIWICGTANRPEGLGAFFVPTVTLARSGSGYTGSGFSQTSSTRFDIAFSVNGRNVTGTLNSVYRQSDADWSYTGTFNCTY